VSRDTDLYIISYDIPNDRRRTKVAKLLLGFGQRVQYSVFECYLDKKQILLLRTRLLNLAKEEEDNVRIYDLCDGCERRVESIGREGPREEDVFIV
jgi:CRISPR-associated protein Cas2